MNSNDSKGYLMDVVILSRVQFAMNIAFHYLFPPLSIGLGLMLIIFEGMYMKTKKPEYKAITKFWMRIFALTFALGVATGLVQVFAFGNNWARFSRFVGDVFGSALAAEGVFAFFLESGFLGIMLFGWDRVSPRLHYLATVLTSLGAHFSAVWIVVANSWMQTPAGFKIVGEGNNARAVLTDFWAMVFNPSSVDRLVHVILGCWLTGSFVVLSVAAYYALKKKHVQFTKTCLKVGLIVTAAGVMLQLVSADSTARGVAKNQPEKLAAIEGVYKTEPNTPFAPIGWIDPEKEEVVGPKIPGLLSFLVYRDASKPVPGLDNFPKSNWPRVPWVFQTYHLMIFMWGAMFLLTLVSVILYKRKTLETSKWTLRALVFSSALPYIANQAGWFTAEMGRQPWLVYKVLRTAQGASKVLVPAEVMGSIIMFIVIYIFLLTLFIYLLNSKIQHGPVDDEEEDKVFSQRISYEGGTK